MRTVLWIVFGLGAAGFAYLIWADALPGMQRDKSVDPAEAYRSMDRAKSAAEVAEFSKAALSALEGPDSAPASVKVSPGTSSGGADREPGKQADALARLTTMVDALQRACPKRINAEEWLHSARIDVDGLVRQVYWIETETREPNFEEAKGFTRSFVAIQRPMLLQAYRTKTGLFQRAREAGRGMRFDYVDKSGLRLAAIELRPEEL